jgi:hypothetical protein
MPGRQWDGTGPEAGGPGAGGPAELVGDLDRPGAWMLLAGGVPQSHVDLADPFPARVVEGAALDRFVAGSRPITDAHAGPSPAPPPEVFAWGGRVRFAGRR